MVCLLRFYHKTIPFAYVPKVTDDQDPIFQETHSKVLILTKFQSHLRSFHFKTRFFFRDPFTVLWPNNIDSLMSSTKPKSP